MGYIEDPCGDPLFFVGIWRFTLRRSAVFVDAGYLYAQGSAALAGQKLSRVQVKLNLSDTIDKLRKASATRTGDASLLRIYWYDGLLGGKLSEEQESLAYTEDVKLRLGIVNWAGQQKGVDSLIVTDIVELARNHAITDAFLLSGDEDLRVGVQIAQSFGVRVHLIGIEPSRGSQSLSLLQEADTTTEWDKAEMGTLLTLKTGFNDGTQVSDDAVSPEVASDTATALEQVVNSFVSSLDPEEASTVDSLGATDTIPRHLDGRLLAMCRNGIGRGLEPNERDCMRAKLREACRVTVQLTCDPKLCPSE